MTPTEETYYRRYLNDIPFGGAQVLPLAFTPITSFSDTFTRANGDLGNNWISQMRNNGGGTSDQFPTAIILNNKLRLSAVGNSNNNISDCLWIPQQLIATNPNTNLPGGIWGKNQYAQITFQAMSTNGSGVRQGIGIFAKNNTGGGVGEAQVYLLAVRYTSSGFGSIDIWKVIGGQNESGGTTTILGTSGAAPSAGDILRLEGTYSGTTVTLVYKKNGTQILSVTDNPANSQIGWPCIMVFTSLGSTVSGDWTNFDCGML